MLAWTLLVLSDHCKYNSSLKAKEDSIECDFISELGIDWRVCFLECIYSHDGRPLTLAGTTCAGLDRVISETQPCERSS